ncbi:MAG: GNAT family N-acetyltransferase [Anaerolineae bacterium]|nr:GNAT family N-acetyltransferase [Anaerolineae bacterium]
MLRITNRSEVLSELEDQARRGDAFFVYYEDGEAYACMIVGESASDGEGFLLQNTNTAQIKSAYSRADSRGKGVGKALLQSTAHWAQQHGYERLFVEHETANYYGGKFWRKHFTSYLYFSMRYIDSAV